MDESILLRLEKAGRRAPRLLLRGGEAASGPDRYEIIGKIAQGGVGEIFRGRDVDLGRDVALKVLREDRQDSGELIQRLVEEAQIGGQLQHPGIVPVFELGLYEGKRPYFAMKLVKGETLAAILKRGDAALDRLLGIFERVCQTVAYAHARHVIHRDLKPSNIMIGSFGEIQVLDWGFAKVLASGGVADEKTPPAPEVTRIATARAPGSDSMAGSIMGTPAYMPPEQALGHVETLDSRCDVFSLGALLCEMLTGAPPYTENVFDQAARADLADAYARLDSCNGPEVIVALCRECLQPMRMDRPGDAEALVTVVSLHLATAEQRTHTAALDAKQKSEAAESARVESQRQRRARTRTLALGVVLLIAVGAVLAGREWSRRRQQEQERLATARVDTAYATALARFESGDWDGASVALEQAQAVAAAEGVSSERVERLVVRTGERVATARAEASLVQRRSTLLKELEAARLNLFNGLGAAGRDAQFDEAFRKFGIDIGEGTVEEAAGKIRETGLDLADALTQWLALRGDPTNPFSGSAQRLEKITNLVDPDRWRIRLRAAVREQDTERLVALGKESAEPGSIALLAGALADAYKHDEAIPLLKEALVEAPSDFWLRFQLGKAYALTKEPEEARLHLDAALALRPNDARVWRNYAWLVRRTHPKEWRRLWRGALRADPDDLGLVSDYCYFLRNKNALDDEMKHWSQRSDRQALFARATAHLLQGRIDESEALARTMLRADPDDAWAHFLVGAFEVHRIHAEDSLERMTEALVRARGGGVPVLRLANILGTKILRKGPIKSVRDTLRRFELEPGSAASAFVLFTLVNKAMSFGRNELAEALLLDLVATAPDYGRAWRLLAELQSALGNAEEAKRSLERAGATGYAVTPLSLVEEAKALWGLGKTNEALAKLREAVEINHAEESSLGHREFLIWSAATGHEVHAVEFYERRARGSGRVADWLWLGFALLFHDDKPAALDAFTRAQKQIPSGLSLWLTKGFAECGRHDLALLTIDAALQNDSSDQTRRRSRIAHLLRLGRRSEALQELDRIPLTIHANVFVASVLIAGTHEPRLAREKIAAAGLRPNLLMVAEIGMFPKLVAMGALRDALRILEDLDVGDLQMIKRYIAGMEGQVRMQRGETTKALELLADPATRTLSLSAFAHFHALIAARRLEEAEAALPELKKSMARSDRLLAGIGLIEAVKLSRRYREAIEDAQRLLAGNLGADPWLNARIHFSRGRYTESLDAFARCVGDTSVRCPHAVHEAHVLGARAALRAGREDLARTWLSAGLRVWIKHQDAETLPGRSHPSRYELAICFEHVEFEAVRKSDDPKWQQLWEEMRAALQEMRRPYWGDDYVVERDE